MFFGCRRRDEDYIYEDELRQYQQDGTLTQLHTAFSREQVLRHNTGVSHPSRDISSPPLTLAHPVTLAGSLPTDTHARPIRETLTSD